MRLVTIGLMLGIAVGGCGGKGSGGMQTGFAPGTFGYDATFLRKHTPTIVLARGDSQVLVAPAYQGRVMTSTTGGMEGPSYGWLNYKVIEVGVLAPGARKGQLEDHMYVFGGEERFWLGPEGGQFAIFFAPGSRFDFEAWHTPPPIDSEPFDTVRASDTAATFSRQFDLVNFSGTTFSVGVERTVRLLTPAEAGESIGVPLGDGVNAVAYETDNRLTNRGREPWTREKGLLSIWLLGMFRPSPDTTVVIPFKAGPESVLGPTVNDAYFGKIPAGYLTVKDDVLFLKGDGTRRGKIGISPARSLGLAGSYAADTRTLTLVDYDVPAQHAGYVNSMWELQKDPLGGDALNAYNDGAPEPGKPPLGPFYELETSSPAASLKPGESIRHVSRTVHISGDETQIDRIARAKLGVGLAAVKAAFAKSRRGGPR
jgi:hypothetical protein